MDRSRKIVFHLARRYLQARRTLKNFDTQKHQHPHMQHAFLMQCNEARVCYCVAKLVLSEKEVGA